MLIKVSDLVQVIAGRDKGLRGQVLSVDRENNRVVVEGVNRVFKHVKRSQRNPQGGRLLKEAPLDVSKVMLVCPKTDKPTRLGVRISADGSKERYSKKSGNSLGVVAPAKSPKGKK
ncbi:MAG: 50S ribosomal protein L24 [Pirellula sp.]|jgi:large subunit ribosomal protein L24